MRYLSRPEVEQRLGLKPGASKGYRLPLPDAQIGARLVGWLPETIDAWQAARPGTGRSWDTVDLPTARRR